MKSSSWIKYFFIFSVFIGLNAAASGTSIRGGGDEDGLAFQSAYLFALNDIRLNYKELYEQIAPSGVYRTAFEARIYVFDGPLFLDDKTRDQSLLAINDPAEISIALSRLRWRELTDTNLRRGMALHEILSLVRLEGTGQYPYSATYMMLKQSEPDKGGPK
jgi:hypothetical protein